MRTRALEIVRDVTDARRATHNPTMYGSVWLVHLVDDHGRAMDAEYHIEADGGHLALIMESRSGLSG